ncbi:C1 family peptidase [Streptomyces adustus]|uniref:C1 family peptidase n=1 Tax=Streptomyces adustus TaxID=1609272 RepID=UPI0035E2E929
MAYLNNSGPARRILNCVPSRDTELDWPPDAAFEGDRLKETTAAAAPSQVDLRAAWWPIGDQMQTGSCVGWATADSVLRWCFVNAGKLPQDDRLSVRYIWMAAKETDDFTSQPTTFIEEDGTSLKAALDVARRFGAVRESELPFNGGLYPGTPGGFYARAAQLKISYFNLGRSAEEWRRWLASGGGPILVRLGVDQTWDDAADTHGKLDVYKRETARGGHAVAIVGYTAERRFIIRNSWGTDWGDRGYGYASEDYAVQAFTEAYGVAV